MDEYKYVDWVILVVLKIHSGEVNNESREYTFNGISWKREANNERREYTFNRISSNDIRGDVLVVIQVDLGVQLCAYNKFYRSLYSNIYFVDYR